ncbi:hypothetical protein CBS101457_006244 [Exobasidium rhododendri]|nr:hypothetical protein CBS101457_006244 [Exobasidium rhododendri]
MVPDEDTEYTEMRDDGLTTHRLPPGQAQKQPIFLDHIEAPQRKSIGAATHLSRITEGAEDEDDEGEHHRRYSIMRADTIMEETEPSSRAASRQDSKIGGSRLPRRSLRSSSSSKFAPADADPFADFSDLGSLLSVDSGMLQRLSAVHRPVGSPTFDLYGKPKSRPTTRPMPDPSYSPRPFTTQRHEGSNSAFASDERDDDPFGDTPGRGKCLSTFSNRSSGGTLAYVMSSPMIVNSRENGGVQRLQLKQGKAQLLRSVEGVFQKGSGLKNSKTSMPFDDDSIDDDQDDDQNDAQNDDDDDDDQQIVLHRARSSFYDSQSNESALTLPLDARRHYCDGAEGEVKNDRGRASLLSNESFGLPFVDIGDRALRDPLDRSPTDACNRESWISNVSRALHPMNGRQVSTTDPGT